MSYIDDIVKSAGEERATLKVVEQSWCIRIRITGFRMFKDTVFQAKAILKWVQVEHDRR